MIAALLQTILLTSSAHALPPASGSKCSANWVNNPAAMACFIQGEEELRSGVAHPHYVACTAAGEVFCCVDDDSGQDCEAVKIGPKGGHGRPNIDNVRLRAMLETQRTTSTILNRISADLDTLASRMEAPSMPGGRGPGPGAMPRYGQPGMGRGPMAGYGPGSGMGPATNQPYGRAGTGRGMMYGSGYGPDGMYLPGPPGEWRDLDLTDAQRTRLRDLDEEFRRKQVDLRQSMRAEFARRAEAPDDASADAIDAHLDALRQEMLSTAIDARKQRNAVLTTEQRRELRRAGR